jgi:hypothetical protein
VSDCVAGPAAMLGQQLLTCVVSSSPLRWKETEEALQ